MEIIRLIIGVIFLGIYTQIEAQTKVDSITEVLQYELLDHETSQISIVDYLGDCSSCIIDSSIVITRTPDFTKVLQCLDILMEESCNIPNLSNIRTIYESYTKIVDDEFGILFSQNHMTDLATKNELINLMLLSMVRFEQLLYVNQLCKLSSQNFYQHYLDLQSLNFNPDEKTSKENRKAIRENLIYHKFKNNSSFGYGGYYLYQARPEIIIEGILNDLKHFKWRNSFNKDYLIEQNIMTQNHFVLSQKELPELQKIFVSNWDNYAKHKKIAYILTSARNISNENLIEKLVLYLLYQNDPETNCPTSYCMRKLFLNCIDRRDYMEQIVLKEARKQLYNSKNPALPYLEMFYSMEVYNFFTNSLADRGVSLKNKKKIASMLRYQYQSMLKFKEDNSDRAFYIRSVN